MGLQLEEGDLGPQLQLGDRNVTLAIKGIFLFLFKYRGAISKFILVQRNPTDKACVLLLNHNLVLNSLMGI